MTTRRTPAPDYPERTSAAAAARRPPTTALAAAGYDDDQLHRGGRYMVLGSVAIDDAEAAAIVDLLREEARIQKSAPEVKFQKMFSERADRRRLLGELLSPGGPVHDRTPVYVIDKPYFVAATHVNLLLEERCNALGHDIVSNGVGRQFALLTWPPKGREHWAVTASTGSSPPPWDSSPRRTARAAASSRSSPTINGC